jgi:multiple sugar transport system substrate-binding protein
MKQKKGITRRNFLKVSGSAAAGSLFATSWASTSKAAQKVKPIRYFTQESDPKTRKFFNKWNDIFLKETGIPVVMEYAALDPWPKLGTYIQAGAPPDVARLGPHLGAGIALQGALMPVDDIIEYVQKYYNHKYSEKQLFKLKEKNYIVTAWGQAPTEWYRSDLYEKAGVEPPETWQKLSIAAKATDNPPKIRGVAVPASSHVVTAFQLWNYLMTNDAKVCGRPNGELEIVLDKGENFDRVLETVLWMKDLYKYSPDSSGWTWTELIESYWTEQVTTAFYGGARQKLQSISNNPKIAPITLGVPTAYNRVKTGIGVIEGLVLFTDAANPDGARKYMKFLLRKDVQIDMARQVSPAHNLSIFADVLNSPEYRNDSWLKENFTKQTLDNLLTSVARATPMVGETDPPNPYAGEIFGSKKLADIIYRVNISKENPEKVIKETAKDLRVILKEAMEK